MQVTLSYGNSRRSKCMAHCMDLSESMQTSRLELGADLPPLLRGCYKGLGAKVWLLHPMLLCLLHLKCGHILQRGEGEVSGPLILGWGALTHNLSSESTWRIDVQSGSVRPCLALVAWSGPMKSHKEHDIKAHNTADIAKILTEEHTIEMQRH